MTMRYTKYIALVALLFAAVACTNYEFDIEGGLNNGVEGETTISIYGNVTRFSDYEVGTRANKTPEESYVSNMALAVFATTDNKCIHYELRDGSNLLFTLDRSEIQEKYGTAYNNVTCVMYVLANMPNLPATGTFEGTKEELLNLALSAPGITRPDKGFPMMGTLGNEREDRKTFVLMPMNGNRMELPLVNGDPTDYLNIPMNAIFAKISFEITVSADQDVDIHDPARFELAGYEVHNLPSAVSFNKEHNKEGVQGVSTEPVEIAMTGIAQGGDEGGGSSINFDFYLPERLLTPTKYTSATYPYPLGEKGETVTGYSSIPDKHKKYAQRYKPLLLGDGQKATYVTIKGKYRDHQENYHTVSYDIYIGADNYGDFNIERNSQYINKLNIKGITSSADQATNQGAVSIDHRVNVERSSPLIISLRRETQLDAHYEVRPLRLRMAGESVPAGAKVTVEVLNEDGTDTNRPAWVRLEKSGSTDDYYITSGISAGKRKYFTTNLVTSTLAGNTSLTFNTDELRTTATAWIYVDENTNASPVHDTRSATIRVTYYEGNDQKDEKDYVVCQYNMHMIQGKDNPMPYYIECYEEYLYNYDSEEPYGQIKEEGLPWGLDGVQLSSKHLSFNVTENNSEWQDYIAENPALLTYDFYTWAQDSEVLTESGIAETARHDFAGQEFTEEIVSTAGIQYLTMAEQAESAVQYCYNRNKRNADGTVDVKWYLPSTDEMEDFIVAGYSYYEEFQDKYYWTSQPAYNRNAFYYEYKERGGTLGLGTKTVDTYVFNVYEDNIKYARATKVDYDLKPIPSGLNDEPKVKGDLGAEADNNPEVGYFSKWHQWKRARNGNVTTATVTNADQYFWEFKNETDMHKRYYGFVSDNYDMTKEDEDINPDYDMRQEGYMRRTKPNRVRCAYRND